MASDDFNRADAGTLGANWTDTTAGLGIAGNRAVPAAGAGAAFSYYSGAACQSAHTSAVVFVSGGAAAVTVRHQPGGDLYALWLSNGINIRLYKVLGGVFTELVNYGVTPTFGHTYKLDADGTTLKAYDNGAQLGSDHTDGALTDGVFGIGGDRADPGQLDDWIGTDTTPPPIDLSANLVSHWPMDEVVSGADAADRHGSNNLTLLGADDGPQQPIDGTPARASEFAEANCFTHADNADLSLGADEAFTFIVRVETESGSSNTVFVSKDQAADADYDFRLHFVDGAGFRLSVKDGSGTPVTATAAPTSMTSGTTYVVAGGHDPVTDKIWVRVNGGARVETAHTTGTRDSASTTFRVAARSGASGLGTGETLDGAIGPVSFWKRSLSDQDITDWISVDGVYEDFIPARRFFLARF